MKYVILLTIMILTSLSLSAQKERKFIRKGNDLFSGNDYEKSEVEYRKALDKKESSFEAKFNLGDALYKQKKFDEALDTFEELSAEETDKERLGKVFYNMGNSYLSMQKYDEAIEAYKNSLRNYPASKEAKYNLEWARAQKKKQQDQKNKNDKNQDNKNKDKQDKKDQNKQENKDKQNQDKQKEQNKQDEQKSDKQQNQDKNKKDEQGKQGDEQEQKGKISKEAAKRLLEALENDEKKVQEKVKKAKVKEQKAKKKKISKDW